MRSNASGAAVSDSVFVACVPQCIGRMCPATHTCICRRTRRRMCAVIHAVSDRVFAVCVPQSICGMCPTVYVSDVFYDTYL